MLPSEKMRKEIEEHDGMNGLAEQVLLGKTIDFLEVECYHRKHSRNAGPEAFRRIKMTTNRDPIILNPCSFRWWSSRPAAASAATISIRGC